MEGRDRRGQRTKFVRGFSGFDVDKFIHVAWFVFMEMIINNGDNFKLQALINFEPVTQFECTSDM